MQFSIYLLFIQTMIYFIHKHMFLLSYSHVDVLQSTSWIFDDECSLSTLMKNQVNGTINTELTRVVFTGVVWTIRPSNLLNVIRKLILDTRYTILYIKRFALRLSNLHFHKWNPSKSSWTNRSRPICIVCFINYVTVINPLHCKDLI